MKRFLVFVGLIVFQLSAPAMYLEVDLVDVPIKRVLSNLHGKAKRNPDDGKLQHLLARAHAMAFAAKLDDKGKVTVQRFKLGDGIWFGYDPPAVPYDGDLKARIKKEEKLENSEGRKEHLQQAIIHYEKAIELKVDGLVPRLGLAWCRAQDGQRDAAIADFRKLIDDAESARKKSDHPEFGNEAVSEAITYLLPLLGKEGNAKEIVYLSKVKKQIDSYDRPITPIVIPLRDGLAVGDIIAHDQAVVFDLDASGRAGQGWEWIRPESAGWLVHDPRATGSITSGLQLFGSRTFTMFFENGYQALGLLDDNGDGALRAEELDGLAVWVDQDSDGVSDLGEVRNLAELGIVALGCEGQVLEEGGWFAERGVEFDDGNVRPSFDLVLRPYSK